MSVPVPVAPSLAAPATDARASRAAAGRGPAPEDQETVTERRAALVYAFRHGFWLLSSSVMLGALLVAGAIGGLIYLVAHL